MNMQDIPMSIQGVGYFSRMRIYLREMYSVPKHLVSAILIYLSFTFMLRQNYGIRAPFPSSYAIIGSVSIFLFLLILRLMDELKDKEIDLKLFSSRPVPSGRVYESDIRISLALAMVSFVFLNATCSRSMWMSLVLLGYGYLMFKYFFITEVLRRNLILNLISHNPVVALMFLYLVVLFAGEHRLDFERMDWRVNTLLCLMYWSMSFAWEIARKIRSTAEENAYVTYSRLFGKRGAVALAASAQTFTFVLVLLFAELRGFSVVYVAVSSIGYAAVIFAHIRFLVNPTPATSRLKPWAEAFMLTTALAGCCEAVTSLGAQ